MSDLTKDIKRAETILHSFTDSSLKADIKTIIPPSILAKAHGIVFIRLYRAGFLISAKGGTGIIIARMPDGSWSAPSGVSMTSVGVGHLIGGEIIDSVIVMNYRGAVKAFYDAGGQIQLGVGVSISAGPVGRAAEIAASAGSKHVAATYAYSASKGLFVGYSFEGSRITERAQINASFYGRPITAAEVLNGAVPPPMAAKGLYDKLYALGAAGPQPGVVFGPVKSAQYSMPPSPSSITTPVSPFPPPLPPHPTAGKQPHSFSVVPTSPTNSVSSVPDGGKAASAMGRTSLQPSASIRNPPPTNPRLANNQAADAASSPHVAFMEDLVEPPPSYETAVGSPIPPSANAAPGPPTTTMASLPPPSAASEKAAMANTLSNPTPASVPPPPPAATPDVLVPILMPTTAPTAAAPLTTVPGPLLDTNTTSHTQPTVDASTQKGFVVVAKYDFHGQEATDLSFMAGDYIIVTNWTESRDSWWHGVVGNRSGNFPANYTNDME
ncbi:DUF500-domain-containing protein [Hesseltinella vesiculosa]|uniref:DUF500-domain-containing protein n=1 Tax=Hesseltinella vesiculosa TaxID=101127 RepID=A0A1X2GB73_9FUNG|nr:DUF500-domain-containing protein [Hesseltinella vesiculosa]